MSTLLKEIARTLYAYQNSIESGSKEWKATHLDHLHELEKQLPSGSGIDAGTKIDLEKSTPEKVVLHTSYHHMNDGGFYDGWTDHTVTVTASLAYKVQLKISGRNRREIKDYLYEVFQSTLLQKYRT